MNNTMMADVAKTAMTNDYWGSGAVVLVGVYCIVSVHLTFAHIIGGKWRGLGARLKHRAKLCLDQTGFVGAVITRHTLLVTMNVIVVNLSLNLMSALRGMGEQATTLTMSLQFACAVCIMLIVLIAVVTFRLCSEVVRQAEQRR